LIKTSITSGVLRLNVQYSESVITLSGVVNAETMTQGLVNQTVNVDIIEEGGWWLISMEPRDVGSGSRCHVTRQNDVITVEYTDNTKCIWTSCVHIQAIQALKACFHYRCALRCVGLSLFKFVQYCMGSKRRIFSALECVLAVQGHPKSMILAPIESAYATSY